jgi:hypothetical protein
MDEPWSRASVAKRESKVILIAPDRAHSRPRPALAWQTHTGSHDTPHRRHRISVVVPTAQKRRENRNAARRRPPRPGGGAPPAPPRAHGTTAESRYSTKNKPYNERAKNRMMAAEPDYDSSNFCTYHTPRCYATMYLHCSPRLQRLAPRPWPLRSALRDCASHSTTSTAHSTSIRQRK